AAAGAIALLLIASACYRPPNFEEPDALPTARRSTIVAQDGSVLATLFTENRDPVAFADIPQVLVDAVVAAEDQRFWSHKGVDVKAIVRAGLRNVSEKEAVQGGSTITQQYVKNVYYPIDRPKTFQQKVREAQLAIRIEERFSKQEILEKYMNTVYFGDGAYGVKAAAEEFFRKPISSLTLAEAALLAGIIRSPESDNPRRNFQRAYLRRSYVLGRMRTLGTISPEQEGEASAAALGVLPPPQRPVTEPHFVEYIKQSIINDPVYGEKEADRAALLFRGGIQIKTTLDLRLQHIARQAIGDVLGRPGDPEVALVSIETQTGKIRAMVGGRDFNQSQVDLALGRT
ncbi:MAG: transglycosylase domain-containing protein, partial [Acidimicrobiia bacterium]